METHEILRRSERRIAAAVAAGLSGAAVFLTGVWVGSARGGSVEDPGIKPRHVPTGFCRSRTRTTGNRRSRLHSTSRNRTTRVRPHTGSPSSVRARS